MYRTKIDKKPNNVMKDFKRYKAVRKGTEKYKSKLKESILNDAIKEGGMDTCNASNDATNTF